MKIDIADKVLGTLLGAAIGDALGAPFEYAPSAVIEDVVGGPFVKDYLEGFPGSSQPPHPKGMPTDDTAFSLSLADALASPGPITADAIAKAFLRDLGPRGRFKDMLWKGAFGGATSRALWRLETGASPATNGHPEDGGNGSAMRAHVAGLLPKRSDVLRVAALQARITHGHPAAIAAAQAQALAVYNAIRESELSNSFPTEIDESTLRNAWALMHLPLTKRQNAFPRHLRDVSMDAWTTVSAAHEIAWLYQGDPEMAIGTAAAAGGDCDTLASMVGALIGATHGASKLPARWRRGLKHRDLVESSANGLLARYYPRSSNPPNQPHLREQR